MMADSYVRENKSVERYSKLIREFGCNLVNFPAILENRFFKIVHREGKKI